MVKKTIQTQDDICAKYFSCTDAERAVFEAGIKLGTIFHQYIGVPVSMENVSALEKAIEKSAKVQPFVVDAKVKIDRKKLRRKKKPYSYFTLTGTMLRIQLRVRYKNVETICAMKSIKELRYPLMFVKKVMVV